MKSSLGWGVAGVAALVLALPLAGVAGAAALTGSGTVSVSSSLRPPPPISKDGPGPASNPIPVPVPPSAGGGATEYRATLEEQGLVCASTVTGTVPGAPSLVSPRGVGGTTSADLRSFALAFNDVRVDNCLRPIPLGNFRYDSCMEARLFWIAEDPSEDPASAWGHVGTRRSDGVPSVGCDGNLAGGMNNSGQTVAIKWWDSTAHRASLYKPSYTGSTANVCIFLAMTHGGVPNEPTAFTRAAARWGAC